MAISETSSLVVRPHAKPGAVVSGIPPAGEVTPSAYFRWKSGLDFVLAAVLLILALPVIGILILLVWMTSHGPAIYSQARVGKHGRRFMMFKIRTMRKDAEAATGPVWTVLRDPRITPVGRVLRKLHLDELPQLFNVLKGEMSLIGPRPERPEFVHKLAAALPDYTNRLAVRPGVTGLAQVNLPPDTDLDSVRRKLVLDLDYIEQATFLLDVRLFLCTLGRMFRIPLVRVLGLRRKVAIPEFPRDAGEEPTSLVNPTVVLGAPPAGGNGAQGGNGEGGGNAHADGNGHADAPRRGKKHKHRRHHKAARGIKPR
jgi:lipopolysaccharide/colanic/teichoic acid biosynthesis glycosyltransferase